MTHQADTGHDAEAPDSQPTPDEASRGPLTDLATRDAFLTQVADALASQSRRKTVTAVLAVGLDQLARVTDTFGHALGTMLLQLAAQRLSQAVRSAGAITRIGESEFAVLLVGPQGFASEAATRVVDAIERPYLLDGHVVNVGVSLGVVETTDDRIHPADLHRHAALALSLARTSGHGQVRFFDPALAARATARQVLEFDLRRALPLREFELFYQPQIELASGRLSGFEALLRWHHPTRGLVSPDDFIPVAEEVGLIVAIGGWVLQTACEEAMRWPVDVTVAVNVATAQFAGGRLVDVVAAALAASGLPPERLEIEVTEGVLMRAGDAVADTLHALRRTGVRISMDDFGTGYSSLTQLKAFPFDKIKIDRSLVADIGLDPAGAVFVRAITAMSVGLGMRTVVEGIETTAQMEHVRAEGCTEAQGFLIGRPVPAAAIPELIARIGDLPPALVARLRLVA
jgi:diguanylate cyclase (GGDEF)-like protein